MLPGWHVTSVPLVSVRFGCGAWGRLRDQVLWEVSWSAEGMADVHRALRAS